MTEGMLNRRASVYSRRERFRGKSAGLLLHPIEFQVPGASRLDRESRYSAPRVTRKLHNLDEVSKEFILRGGLQNGPGSARPLDDQSGVSRGDSVLDA